MAQSELLRLVAAQPGISVAEAASELLPTNLAADFGVLAGASTAAITVASLLLPRLAR